MGAASQGMFGVKFRIQAPARVGGKSHGHLDF